MVFLFYKSAGAAASRFEIDPTATPKTIDVMFEDSESRLHAFFGIYELNGDDCKMIFADAKSERPESFDVSKGKRRLFVLRRGGDMQKLGWERLTPEQATDKTQQVYCRNDIAQLSTAITGACDTMQARFVPCSITIRSSYDKKDPAQLQEWRDLQQFFGERFGIADGDNVLTGLPDWGKLNGNQCLVFFLGGYQDGKFGNGFSDSSTHPFKGTGRNRGPFFDFLPSRLLEMKGTVPQFLDPWGTPYAYMTTRNANSDYYSDERLQPFTNADGKFLNPRSFQIISAGKNKTFGPGGQWVPGEKPYSPDSDGGDDLSNFHDFKLGSGK
jgi:hypothetical protein